MQKFLVIALILSLSNENLAWKNLNPKSYLENRPSYVDSCLKENKIVIGLTKYYWDIFDIPRRPDQVAKFLMKLTMELVSICENSKDPIRCLGIETAFGLHIMKLIKDRDVQSLLGFEKKICAMIEEKNYCSDCETLFTKLPYDLFATDFVMDFISKTDYLNQIGTDLIKEIWMEPYSKYMEKDSEKMCSFVCPTFF